MQFLTPIRVGLLVGTACASALGQALPPTAPTAPQAIQAQPQRQAAPQAQRAQVELNGKMLSVVADNSSLNQILRDISRVTGMKITGGVTDERVFGTYGPADPSTVISALLGGTGSNMLIVLDARQAPQELVLTPRSGGATPPNPNASRDRGEEDLPPQRSQHFPRQDGSPNFQMPNQAPPPLTPAQLAPLIAPQAPTPQPGSDTTTQESPNGVKTPQQIYDQLMKMQQQQQQQQPKDQ